ncbi:MAG: TM2 domain-containing protein, partial [Myxococcales bacterium]
LDRSADVRYESGPVSYNVTWILLTFVGLFGIHRIYMGKYLTGLIYFLTGGLFLVGILYDYWTLNEQLDAVNAQQS